MNCKQQAGFTLIELVVGIFLMMIIMSSIAGLFTNLLKHGVQGMDQMDNEQEARMAVNMMVLDIRYAKNFNGLKGASDCVDVVRVNSVGNYMRVRYRLVADPDRNNRLALQRIVNIPVAPVPDDRTASIALANASEVMATSWIGNPDREYVGANDFIVTTQVPDRTVTAVKIEYKIKRHPSDNKQGVAETTVYPLNDLEVGVVVP